MKQHKLVILGSMDEFVELVRRAQSRGIYTIVCDGYENGPAKELADKSYLIDIRDVKAVAKMCADEKVDGIVTSFSDIMFEYLVKIAHEAGLPCYLTPDKLPFLREKPVMKKMLGELGVEVPRNRKITREFKSSDLAELRFPLVIKPLNGYGSRGIYIVTSEEEIRTRFDEICKYSSFDGEILAEEYNDGYEFNMMNWVAEGTVYVLSLADREKADAQPGDIPYVTRVAYPSRLIDDVLDEAREIVQKVADYVGMQEGPLSMQFFWKPGRKIQVCEITGRLFGYEHELVMHAGGPNIEDLLLDYVYDKDAMKRTMKQNDPHFPKMSAGLYFHGRDGIVGDLSKARQAAQTPRTLETLIYYNTGETISHEVGAKPYFTRVYIGADTREELDQTTQKIYENMTCLDPEGKELVLPNRIPRYDR